LCCALVNINFGSVNRNMISLFRLDINGRWRTIGKSEESSEDKRFEVQDCYWWFGMIEMFWWIICYFFERDHAYKWGEKPHCATSWGWVLGRRLCAKINIRNRAKTDFQSWIENSTPDQLEIWWGKKKLKLSHRIEERPFRKGINSLASGLWSSVFQLFEECVCVSFLKTKK